MTENDVVAVDHKDSIECDPSDTVAELEYEMNMTQGYPGAGWEETLPDVIRSMRIDEFGAFGADEQVELMDEKAGRYTAGTPLSLINRAMGEVLEHGRDELADWSFGFPNEQPPWEDDE
jgi:hypothetical protein